MQVLITGGTGFLGSNIIKRLVDDNECERIVVPTLDIRQKTSLKVLGVNSNKVDLVNGDVRDFDFLRLLFNEYEFNGVFHLAAFKHVGIAEIQVRECIKTNTIGSMNILEESLDTKPEFVLSISTDKAAQISGVYGATKFLMERLHEQFERLNSDTKYRLVRYGNVLYSTGSVLCKWKELLQQGKEVIVTDGEATRFFWTVDQALDLIEGCMESSIDCKVYCPEMKSMTINNLLKAMAEKYLPAGKDLKIKYIGLQPGENLHEKVLEEGPYSNECEQYTIEEIKELI